LAVLERWKGLTSSGATVSVVLAGLDEGGRMVARYALGNARPAKITAPMLDAKGNDVAIEEIVIEYEGLRIASSGSGRQRDDDKP
jgi:phage tail-like protein